MPSAEEQAARLTSLARELGEEMTQDGLTRDFKIFQRRRGHRHSTDDLLTAWYAATHAPPRVETLLDLGSGIGSIGLSLVWYFRNARLTAIEVQDISFRLLSENICANGVTDRVRAIHGDLRTVTPTERFDLITGSPPYFDVSTGIVSADSQRAAARFELHGDVRDYCRAAQSALAPDGVFAFCFPTAQRARAEQAVGDAGLRLVTSCDVIPKEGATALFSLFACRTSGEHPFGCHEARHHTEPPFVVRDKAGAHTTQLTAARALFGFTE